MKYPVAAYSWYISSENRAFKVMDKSAFLHHGSAIPQEIAPFFELPKGELEGPRDIILEVDGGQYQAHIQMDPTLGRFRLFWKADLAEQIGARYPELHRHYAEDNTGDLPTPQMKFKRLESNHYLVDFIDPKEPGVDWSDVELEAAVGAYFEMLQAEAKGEAYNKADFNRRLRTSILSGRSKGSVEFRMQNISAVLQELCHPTIEGYLPRGNVGADVSERIKRAIFQMKYLKEQDYDPTGDEVELERRTRSILAKGLKGTPPGRSRPTRRQATQVTYDRDPLVKAWVLDNANGTCELCGQPGPFKDSTGQFFLEAHHAVFLSEGGEDTINNCAALCPNCHRLCHYSPHKENAKRQIQERILKNKADAA